jgi:hypothetical protein
VKTYDDSPLSLRRVAFLVMTHTTMARIARVVENPRAELHKAAGLEAGEARATLDWLREERTTWTGQPRPKPTPPRQLRLRMLSVAAGGRKTKSAQPPAATASAPEELRRKNRDRA